jgi:hypothetical protein
MSEAETEDLLQELNHRSTSKNEEEERRKHPRKRAFIHIDCSGNKCAFTDFIQNISESGLYIECLFPILPIIIPSISQVRLSESIRMESGLDSMNLFLASEPFCKYLVFAIGT